MVVAVDWGKQDGRGPGRIFWWWEVFGSPGQVRSTKRLEWKGVKPLNQASVSRTSSTPETERSLKRRSRRRSRRRSLLGWETSSEAL